MATKFRIAASRRGGPGADVDGRDHRHRSN
jgi:hypothetical protein